jgi:hypothetical protein
VTWKLANAAGRVFYTGVNVCKADGRVAPGVALAPGEYTLEALQADGKSASVRFVVGSAPATQTLVLH